jgi:hypothetical protein
VVWKCVPDVAQALGLESRLEPYLAHDASVQFGVGRGFWR